MKKKLKKQNRVKSKLFAAAVVIVLCIATVYWAKSTHRFKQELKKSLLYRTIGNPKADIRIVEYIDFQCSSCAKGYFLLKKYLKKYPSKIQVELKYFPLTKKRHALESALYAECSAKQDKFWEFTQFLLEKQHEWKHSIDAEMIFREIARDVGVDEFELADCIVDEQTKKTILTEKNEGKILGIRRTPTYFINGRMVVGLKSLKRELSIYFK